MFKDLNKIYGPFLKKEIIGPILIIIGALFLYSIITHFIKRIFRVRTNKMDERKSKTIISILNNACKYILLIIAILMILDLYGISTSGILTSIGIVGVVAGLAVQDILKDILSGASIIVENQYAVGDVVSIDDFKGEVLSLGLRTTKIKAYTGEIMIFANRNITKVINYSMSKSLAIVNIPVSYEEDVEKVEKLLNQLCEKIKKENKLITGDISCIGITSFDDSSINFRITALTEPMMHYDVERFILKEVKILFDREKIEIPFPQVVVHDARI